MRTKHDRSHVALVAHDQLIEHCNGNAKVMGSNPVQSLNFFSGHFSSSVMAAFASFILSLLATVGHLLPYSYKVYGIRSHLAVKVF